LRGYRRKAATFYLFGPGLGKRWSDDLLRQGDGLRPTRLPRSSSGSIKLLLGATPLRENDRGYFILS
jgi:hypothetical protein